MKTVRVFKEIENPQRDEHGKPLITWAKSEPIAVYFTDGEAPRKGEILTIEQRGSQAAGEAAPLSYSELTVRDVHRRVKIYNTHGRMSPAVTTADEVVDVLTRHWP